MDGGDIGNYDGRVDDGYDCNIYNANDINGNYNCYKMMIIEVIKTDNNNKIILILILSWFYWL